MKLTILLAGVSLLASEALAGNVSNVPATLDTTMVDPAPALYPHFICASGCSSGAVNTVTQSGNWNVGISNFPATQTVNGSVSVAGVATSANQPALNFDGGALSHITNLPAIQPVSGSISVSNLPTNQAVTGTVSIGNFPVTQAISGSIVVPGVATAANQPVVNVDGGGLAHITNLPAIQPVSGSISVSNLPTNQAVSGMVSVGNFPATQAISGSITVPGVATAASQPALNGDGGGLAHIMNFPSLQAISGTVSVGNFPSVQPVSGSVAISNLPTNQAVTGTVSVGNFPGSQAVTGSVSVGNFPATQTVTGSLTVPGVATAANQPGLHIDGGGLAHVTNWPVSQLVSGSVSISNLPTTQAVSGSVSVGNFPSVQPVNGTVSIGTSVGFGAAGSPSSSVGTVQGISNGTPVSVSLSDGSDAALGSKADLPSSSGSASVVSLLKQLHLDSLGSISAGSNVIGTVNFGAQTVFNTPMVSATLESSHVFKATAGQLTSAYVVATAAGYLMIFNNASAPSDGAVAPVECIPVTANVSTGISFAGLPPENYAAGITAVFSSTGCFTKTASATAFFHGAVQ